jgi:Domain of unknown function (DUF4262)
MAAKKSASTSTLTHRIEAADKEVRENITAYGCHIYWIGDPKGKEPPFAYSIGIEESCGAPEVIVFGLSANLTQFVINEYNRRAQKHKPFPQGKRHRGFLKGFSVYIEPVATALTKQYMLGCRRLYGNWKFKVAQIIWPSTTGVWPWEAGASEWIQHNQPLLCPRPVQKPTVRHSIVKRKSPTSRKRPAPK